MARSVRDTAILLSAMSGADPNDAATSESAGKTQADYAKFLDPAGLPEHAWYPRKFFDRTPPWIGSSRNTPVY